MSQPRCVPFSHYPARGFPRIARERLHREGISDSLHDACHRGEHPEGSEGSSLHHDLPVHLDLELAVPARDLADLDPEVATEPGRHPGGMDGRHSDLAVANDDARHGSSPFHEHGTARFRCIPYKCTVTFGHGTHAGRSDA